MRRGTRAGFASPEKQAYREAVWGLLAPIALSRLERERGAVVVLMPSGGEGAEISVALKAGIRQEQIVAVDESPAVIAMSKWRKRYPGVRFFGCKISQVPERIHKRGWHVVAANLDFCNNFSAELVDEVRAFMAGVATGEYRFNTPDRPSGPMPRAFGGDFAFCITVARGRETTALHYLITHREKFTEEPRLSCVISLVDELKDHPGLRVLGEGKYTSHRNPMAWGAFLAAEPDFCALERLHKKDAVVMRKIKAAKVAHERGSSRQPVRDAEQELVRTQEANVEYLSEKGYGERGILGWAVNYLRERAQEEDMRINADERERREEVIRAARARLARAA